jgi:hypothetical protein
MSMYTQLLQAAYSQLRIDEPGQARGVALAEARRWRTQLERGTPDAGPETLSSALALEIGYDVALLRLAGLVGIESEPNRFDRPQAERIRLESALAERGVSFKHDSDSSEPLAG